MAVWFRAAIILVWLCLPVGATWLLRLHHERYLAASQAQRVDCDARTVFLRESTTRANELGQLLFQLDTIEDRYDWQRQWQLLEREEQRQQLNLRPALPEHYPLTDALLIDLLAQLEEQQQLIVDAMWDRDGMIKAGDGLAELAAQVGNVRMMAQYYQRIGAEGIYLRLQEELARFTDAYNNRRQQRMRLLESQQQKLAQADRIHRDILRETGRIGELLARDGQVTYREALINRLREFSLKRELAALLRGQAPAG